MGSGGHQQRDQGTLKLAESATPVGFLHGATRCPGRRRECRGDQSRIVDVRSIGRSLASSGPARGMVACRAARACVGAMGVMSVSSMIASGIVRFAPPCADRLRRRCGVRPIPAPRTAVPEGRVPRPRDLRLSVDAAPAHARYPLWSRSMSTSRFGIGHPALWRPKARVATARAVARASASQPGAVSLHRRHLEVHAK